MITSSGEHLNCLESELISELWRFKEGLNLNLGLHSKWALAKLARPRGTAKQRQCFRELCKCTHHYVWSMRLLQFCIMSFCGVQLNGTFVPMWLPRRGSVPFVVYFAHCFSCIVLRCHERLTISHVEHVFSCSHPWRWIYCHHDFRAQRGGWNNYHWVPWCVSILHMMYILTIWKV